MGKVSLVDGHIDGMTNYDRIINKSIEEMAAFLADTVEDLEICDGCPATNFCTENYMKLHCNCCLDVFKKWLEAEVDTK